MGIMSRIAGLFGGMNSADPLIERVKMPCHALYVHWEFAAPLDALEFDLTIHADPGTDVGEYLAPFSGYIDGSQFYFGLQTDIQHPDSGVGTGKGLIFSTWWSFDAADIRVADDGFFQLGTHEGRFVGVRRNVDWTVGDYRVSLIRAELDVVEGREFDWFDLSFTALGSQIGSDRPEPVGETTWIGGVRFPRRTPGTPARIEPRAPLFLEVYSNAFTWADVALFDVDVMAFGNGVRCPRGRTEYARYPNSQLMPNVNVRFDADNERVRMAFGGETKMVDAAGSWS